MFLNKRICKREHTTIISESFREFYMKLDGLASSDAMDYCECDFN